MLENKSVLKAIQCRIHFSVNSKIKFTCSSFTPGFLSTGFLAASAGFLAASVGLFAVKGTPYLAAGLVIFLAGAIDAGPETGCLAGDEM